MDTVDLLVTAYCRAFGFYTCSELTFPEMLFIIASGGLVVLVAIGIYLGLTGASD